MPFSCKFQLNNNALQETDEIIFQEYIDSAFDHYHENPIKIARATFNGRDAFVYSTCPCFVSSKGTIKKGEKITAASIIGYFAANGEDIPYNKPYAIIKFE
jgi:hypothetical protein